MKIIRSKKRISLILYCIIIFLLYSCQKKESKHYTISDNFKEWCLFQNGSYWIYKEDSLQYIDSLYIDGAPIHYTNTININADEKGYIIDLISIPLKSQFFNAWELSASADLCSHLVISFKDSTVVLSLVDNLKYLSKYTASNFSQPAYFENLQYYSSFEINSKDYKDVIKTFFYHFEGGSKEYYFYFAKNVGLIKISGTWNNVGHSWSLLRYKVVQ